MDIEPLRRRSFAIAYRMLGSVSEAEDVVQDALLRVSQTPDIENPLAFVTTVTTRLAITELQSARRRRETYVGSWLPEPVITSDDPAVVSETSEGVSMALLTALETLTPEQRAALILHDVFDYGYDEVASILDTSAANARQLVSRARGYATAGSSRFTVEPGAHAALVAAFFAAARSSDIEGLERLLAEDVAMTGDGGGVVPALGRTVSGRFRVAKTLVNGMREWGRYSGITWRDVPVNGGPGQVFTDAAGRVLGVLALTVVDGVVTSVDAVVNPAKLAHLGEVGDLEAMQRAPRD
ncbi:MAG: RNA polymerase sigma factor SigJ [Microbacteriaceae bacterium]